MAKEADPAAVVETIRASIEASRRGSRRVRAHRFRELFGYQAWSAQRREHVEKLLKEAGIVVQPGLGEAGRDDWLVMSMPTLPEVREEHREPRPPEEWFVHLEQVRLNSEREVEMHFAAPLQRLSVARALLADRPVLLLDEPIAHLDSGMAAAVLDAVPGLAAGRSLLWITHEREELRLYPEVRSLSPSSPGPTSLGLS